MDPIDEKKSILQRLRRVEGQIKGIQRMVDEEKYCGDILIQIAAARAALNKVGGVVLEKQMKECFKNDLEGKDKDEAIDKLLDVMLKYTK
ncbi:MAG: metal-sensitive transcriptional regulator [Firmicutes bacterium]|nr:metal-sensitive transcriptional regulator [Bacillota bacterium]